MCGALQTHTNVRRDNQWKRSPFGATGYRHMQWWQMLWHGAPPQQAYTSKKHMFSRMPRTRTPVLCSTSRTLAIETIWGGGRELLKIPLLCRRRWAGQRATLSGKQDQAVYILDDMCTLGCPRSLLGQSVCSLPLRSQANGSFCDLDQALLHSVPGWFERPSRTDWVRT